MNSTTAMADLNGIHAVVSLTQDRGEISQEGGVTFTVNVTLTLNTQQEQSTPTSINSVEAQEQQTATTQARHVTQSTQPNSSVASPATESLAPKQFAYHWSHEPYYGSSKKVMRELDPRVSIRWPRLNGHLQFDPRTCESYADFRQALMKDFYMKEIGLLLGDQIHLRVAGSKPRARGTFMVVDTSSWESQIVPKMKEVPEDLLCIVFGAHKGPDFGSFNEFDDSDGD